MQRFLCSTLFTRQYLERQSTIAKQIAEQIKTELKRRLTPIRYKGYSTYKTAVMIYDMEMRKQLQ